MLTRAIESFSSRFDRECNRTLARCVDLVQEFCADEIEIPATCYPIETITRFELKSTRVSMLKSANNCVIASSFWVYVYQTPRLVKRKRPCSVKEI
jgi:hypothetical protein